jgi:hypothetical protein
MMNKRWSGMDKTRMKVKAKMTENIPGLPEEFLY